VDALWYYLEKTEGKSREQIQAMLPRITPGETAQLNKVTQMPKPKKKH
jgi:hypothetical protein